MYEHKQTRTRLGISMNFTESALIRLLPNDVAKDVQALALKSAEHAYGPTSAKKGHLANHFCSRGP